MLILNSDMLSVYNELIFPRVCLVDFWDPDPTDFCRGKEGRGSLQLSTGARLLLLCRLSIHYIALNNGTALDLFTRKEEEVERLNVCGMNH